MDELYEELTQKTQMTGDEKMFKYGKRSSNNLGECHDDLIILFTEVIKYIDCSIVDGARSEEEQNKLFHAGKSKVEYPNSKHNVTDEMPLSMAIDAAPYINGGIPWNDTRYFYYFGGFVLAVAEILYANGKMKHKTRWGGDWSQNHCFNDQSFHDLPHFELII